MIYGPFPVRKIFLGTSFFGSQGHENMDILQSWPKVLRTSQLFHMFYYLLETDSFDAKLRYDQPSPPPAEVGATHRQLSFSIFIIERGGDREGALWITLMPVNV